MINSTTRHYSNTVKVFKELWDFLEKQGGELNLEEKTNSAELERLIKGIKESRWPNDENACNDLFNSTSSPRFNNLKNQIRTALVNSICGNASSSTKYNSDIDFGFQKTKSRILCIQPVAKSKL